MNKKVGLWIDNKRAVIFSLANEGAQIKRIPLESEKDIQNSGGPPKKSSKENGEKHLSSHLSNYYDEVFSHICDAESILIFGPGEAKVELKTRLENKQLLGNIVGFESAEKMTDNQIVAKVRQRFLT